MFVKVLIFLVVGSLTNREIHGCIDGLLIGAKESENLVEELGLEHGEKKSESKGIIEDISSNNNASLPIINNATLDDIASLPSIENVTGIDNVSPSLNIEQTQQKVQEVVNKTISNIKDIVDEAEEKWKQWVKNYNCTNSSKLIQCITSARLFKSPHSWRVETSQVEIPNQPPTNIELMTMIIKNSLVDWLREWHKHISEANNKEQVGSGQ